MVTESVSETESEITTQDGYFLTEIIEILLTDECFEDSTIVTLESELWLPQFEIQVIDSTVETQTLAQNGGHS